MSHIRTIRQPGVRRLSSQGHYMDAHTLPKGGYYGRHYLTGELTGRTLGELRRTFEVELALALPASPRSTTPVPADPFEGL